MAIQNSAQAGIGVAETSYAFIAFVTATRGASGFDRSTTLRRRLTRRAF
jgi:hypothetical protein